VATGSPTGFTRAYQEDAPYGYSTVFSAAGALGWRVPAQSGINSAPGSILAAADQTIHNPDPGAALTLLPVRGGAKAMKSFVDGGLKRYFEDRAGRPQRKQRDVGASEGLAPSIPYHGRRP